MAQELQLLIGEPTAELIKIQIARRPRSAKSARWK